MFYLYKEIVTFLYVGEKERYERISSALENIIQEFKGTDLFENFYNLDLSYLQDSNDYSQDIIERFYEFANGSVILSYLSMVGGKDREIYIYGKKDDLPYFETFVRVGSIDDSEIIYKQIYDKLKELDPEAID